jgi:endonuclease YncB( thermonuclease family)
VSVTEKRLRKPFAAAVAGGWLGIVGLLTFVFPASNRYTGRIVAISESAHVVVLRDGQPRSLRLAEVDFPEKGRLRAREARALANRLALGRDVSVEEARLADGSREAYVILPGGRSLSAELVKAGLAWPSARRTGRHASSLAALEMRAMSDRRGVWAEPATPPPAFREARTPQVSKSLDVEPSSVDADANEVEEAPLAEKPAAGETAVASLGEN